MSNLIVMTNYLAVTILLIALVILSFELFSQRQLAKKLVCLEILANLIIAAFALLAIVRNQAVIVDVCLAVALIMFLSNVAYCQYRERGNHE